MIFLSSDIEQYVRRLVATFPSIWEIWLVGSRANRREQPHDDWDFVVFAHADFLYALRAAAEFRRSDVDLFIVGEDDLFQCPWRSGDASGPIEGRFEEDWIDEVEEIPGWHWRQYGATDARYTGRNAKHQVAFRIHPASVRNA